MPNKPDPLKALMQARAISPEATKASVQQAMEKYPVLGEAIAPLEFPAKVPSLSTGHRLLDELWGQIDKIRNGRPDDMRKLAELMPDYKPGRIDKYLHTNANVEPSAQAYFDRIGQSRNPAWPAEKTGASIPEKVWDAIANGSHRLAVEDNATLEKIMRFLAD